MKNLYIPFFVLCCIGMIPPLSSKSQNCILLQATYQSFESRCAATGSIKVFASGGSGNYKYKASGPVNTNFTTSDSISGLSAGVYSLVVNDIITNCSITIPNIVIAGSYQDPRFTLNKIDVSCDNGDNGSITAVGQQFGRAPFTYTIVAPSPMGVGTSNNTGEFTGLIAGDYGIQLTDSCGGIQTRRITVGNYTWWIDAYSFTKTACDEATGYIKVVDSKGNVSTVSGIPGFTYGVVRTPGDTIWSSSPNFTFNLNGHDQFTVLARDACGIIKKAPVAVSLSPGVGAHVNTSNFTCRDFTASVNGVINFFDAEFCLYDEADVLISCNTTGTFTNIPYGSYCIKAHDNCTDTTIVRCFHADPPPISIGNNVQISDKDCISFTASITGQVGLTNPTYCLYDSVDVQINCNSTGVFNNLPYGPYCIKTTDGCRDTTITRCFNPTKPTPVVYPIVPAYITCTNFGIVVQGDSLTGPTYCLFDSNAVLIMCNNTGIFDSIPLGNYCVSVKDSCYDTTITHCFSVLAPIAHNDLSIRISNETCTSFTVTAGSGSLNITQYCLYDDAGVRIDCNSTGVFDNVPLGSYCIQVEVTCPDTTLSRCFTVSGQVPSVGGTVTTSNFTCTTFTATIGRQDNLTDPQFCIYDSHDVLISCNTRGVFNNLPYGSYCIKITNSCYDTTIIRCFSKAATPVSVSVNANKSCTFGFAEFNVGMGGGNLPVNVSIFNPDGSLFMNALYNRNNVTIDSIPGLPSGQQYKIVAIDNCGNKDSAYSGSTASYFTHDPVVIPKCPGGSWANGSGDIKTSVGTNLGSVTVRITKKNNVPYASPLTPDFVSGSNYTFYDLGPASYVIRYVSNTCSKTVYDTITISPYQFPNLNRSSAYQCDANGFSVSAIANNGVAPFMYEIIGSVPTTPSIIAGPQASPIFNIDNGATYSLIRLRAVDACGNATLGDASILPLANNGIVVTNNCFAQPSTLSVDSIFNASYTWYKKTNINSVDSTFMGSSSSLFIPMVSTSDTGVYVCYLTVNAGCIKRTYYFNLNGLCYIILPIVVGELRGQHIHNENVLNWKTSREEDLRDFVVERKSIAGEFSEIGRVAATGNNTDIRPYTFTDKVPLPGLNYYRLKLLRTGNRFSYSNTIVLNTLNTASGISIFPNPVKERFSISFDAGRKHTYKIIILNTMNQVISQQLFTTEGKGLVEIQRPASSGKGMYILRIIDMDTNEEFAEKLIFL